MGEPVENYAVSVIMPTLLANLDHVREAVSSLNVQTFRNFEVLFFIDGSPEREQALQELLRTANFQYRVIVSSKRRGVARALNILCRCAKAGVIARMDDDDVCDRDRLRKQLKAFALSQPDVLGSSVWLLDQTGRHLGKVRNGFDFTKDPTPYELLFGDLFFHPTVMFRKSWWQQNRYNTNWANGQDRELWLRSIDSSKFQNLQEPLLGYRVRQPGHTTYRRALQNKLKILTHFSSIFGWRIPFFYALVVLLKARALLLSKQRRR